MNADLLVPWSQHLQARFRWTCSHQPPELFIEILRIGQTHPRGYDLNGMPSREKKMPRHINPPMQQISGNRTSIGLPKTFRQIILAQIYFVGQVRNGQNFPESRIDNVEQALETNLGFHWSGLGVLLILLQNQPEKQFLQCRADYLMRQKTDRTRPINKTKDQDNMIDFFPHVGSQSSQMEMERKLHLIPGGPTRMKMNAEMLTILRKVIGKRRVGRRDGHISRLQSEFSGTKTNLTRIFMLVECNGSNLAGMDKRLAIHRIAIGTDNPWKCFRRPGKFGERVNRHKSTELIPQERKLSN